MPACRGGRITGRIGLHVTVSNYTPFSNDPPLDHYRLTQLVVQNGGLVNRAALQALSLAELQTLAHLMADQPLSRFTPDLAWAWLRMTIEPLEWEIRTERWATGLHYVATWAGEAVACRPAEPDQFVELCHTMRAFFEETYPKTLAASRWTTAHIPLVEASHAN